MDSEDEEEYWQWIQYWKKELDDGEDEPLSKYPFEVFVSRSAGRDKKRNREAEVEILTLLDGDIVILMNGRWPKKKRLRMDSVAEEAVGDICPPDKDPLDFFLYLLRQRDRKRKERKARINSRGW